MRTTDETIDAGFEPCGCGACGEPATVIRHRRSATAIFGQIRIPVTELWRECVSCGQRFTNSMDADWRLEARDVINLVLGNPAGTRLPGVKLA